MLLGNQTRQTKKSFSFCSRLLPVFSSSSPTGIPTSASFSTLTTAASHLYSDDGAHINMMMLLLRQLRQHLSVMSATFFLFPRIQKQYFFNLWLNSGRSGEIGSLIGPKWRRSTQRLVASDWHDDACLSRVKDQTPSAHPFICTFSSL